MHRKRPLTDVESFVATIESEQRHVDVVDLFDLGRASGFDPIKAVGTLMRNDLASLVQCVFRIWGSIHPHFAVLDNIYGAFGSVELTLGVVSRLACSFDLERSWLAGLVGTNLYTLEPKRAVVSKRCR